MSPEDVQWLVAKLEAHFSKEDFDRLEQMCRAPDFLQTLQYIAEQRGSNP